MGNYQTLKKIAYIAKRIEKELLPDICTIEPAVVTGTISDAGILIKDAPVLRQYNGSTQIPCRVDISRSFRPEKGKVAAVVADEYNCEFPKDLTIETSDRVFVNGTEFRIRKLKAMSEWDATKEALIEEVDYVSS